MNSREQISVRVDRILYPPVLSDKTWFILDTDQGIVKGSMAWRPEQGERLKLEGQWGQYQGKREFKFQTAIPDVPVDPRDQLRYVCERTKGIGYATEVKIWEAMGANWRNVTITQVKELGRGNLMELFREMVDTLDREAEKTQAIAWLIGHGATLNMASAAWDRWQQQTIGVVQANCYRLAELPHYGFCHVDAGIRVAFGITDDDPRRVKAAVVYSLLQLTSSGSTAIDWPLLRDFAVKQIGAIHLELIVQRITEMFDEGSLRGFPGTQRIALGADYQNEMDIWEFLNGV